MVSEMRCVLEMAGLFPDLGEYNFAFAKTFTILLPIEVKTNN